MNENPFETLNTSKVQKGRFTIVQDRVRVNGKEQDYDYLEIRSGVCVLPVIGEEILLQKQYRYPVQSWQWELPGGFIDEGEIAEQAAIRELKEETGYDAKNIQSLGIFYPSFGSTNEKIYLFLVRCNEKKDCTSREPGEVITIEKVKIEELQKLIANGEFRHGAGLAAWARYISKAEMRGSREIQAF